MRNLFFMYLWLFKHQDKREKPMYKNGKYRETDKMSDLICENYPMVLVMSRFGIALGFGEKNIGEVCRQNGVDPCHVPDRRKLSDGRDIRADDKH